MVTNFFLGANSSAGFQSLYGSFVDPETNRDILILKGGPGVGKSTLMKYIGKQAEEAGEDVEYIWCSGDPDSLDAVCLPGLGVIAVDGTAPHVVEPRYPAAVDRYVDLGRFYQVDALKAHSEAVKTCTKEYQECYRRAYRALRAAGEVEETLREALSAGYDWSRMQRRTRGILARECKKRGTGMGEIRRRFLGGPTCQGMVWRLDTVTSLADRIYLLEDEAGLADPMLRCLLEGALEKSYDVIVCPEINRIECLQHLIIPELRLAFITEQEGMEGKMTPYRRIHLEGFLDKANQKRSKTRCRFQRRMEKLLLEEGMTALREAKAGHDRLEAIYNPYVDFAGVHALACREWERIAEIRGR